MHFATRRPDAIDYLGSAFELHLARNLTAPSGKSVFVYRGEQFTVDSQQSRAAGFQSSAVSHQ